MKKCSLCFKPVKNIEIHLSRVHIIKGGKGIVARLATPSGGVLTDTHAASLTGVGNVISDGQNESVQNNAAAALAGSLAKAMVANTSEQDVDTTKVGTVTPSNAANVMFAGATFYVQNDGATATTFTFRVRLDTTSGTIIGSKTTASLSTGVSRLDNVFGVLSDVSVAAHDIECTVQRTTASQAYDCMAYGIWGVSSLSDTHAATLTGTASCSACACT